MVLDAVVGGPGARVFRAAAKSRALGLAFGLAGNKSNTVAHSSECDFVVSPHGNAAFATGL